MNLNSEASIRVNGGMKQMLFTALKLLLTLGIFSTSTILNAFPRDRNLIDEADELSEMEAWEYLQTIRSFTYGSDYVFRFKLKHYPPRERTITRYGTWYGHHDPITGDQWERIQIQQRDSESPGKFKVIKDLLIRRGISSAAWIQVDDPENGLIAQSVDSSEGNEPILDNISLSLFDLMAPFLFWPEFDYQGPSQIKARPSQAFLLHAPKVSESQVQSVQVELDDEFRAILKAEFNDTDGEMLKSMELISFKKTFERYIPKTIDYRDYENEGHKSRVEIIAANMEVDLPDELFSPENLSGDFPSLPNFVFDVF